MPSSQQETTYLDHFLTLLLQEKWPHMIYLRNGTQLNAPIHHYDETYLYLGYPPCYQLVRIDAVATICCPGLHPHHYQ